MFQLPIEVQRIIFSFDNTYKKKFNKVMYSLEYKIVKLEFSELIFNEISEINESLDGEDDEDYIEFLKSQLSHLKLNLILSSNREDKFNNIYINDENQEGPNYDEADKEYHLDYLLFKINHDEDDINMDKINEQINNLDFD